MSETRIIPIFPLDLVLFPNQDLPLRIFEPRYKQMIDDCMLGEKEFGICLGHDSATLSNWQAPYDIGTLAKISDCKDVGSRGIRQLALSFVEVSSRPLNPCHSLQI